jgi:2-polyprenyl-6-methoxyphenol hydroxylase-like FAD-dependent oxidoreductase
MSLPESIRFLIVGAGPSGLACAISLNHHGCRELVVVDAVLEGQNTSRAMVIHAATLEVCSCYMMRLFATQADSLS